MKAKLEPEPTRGIQLCSMAKALACPPRPVQSPFRAFRATREWCAGRRHRLLLFLFSELVYLIALHLGVTGLVSEAHASAPRLQTLSRLLPLLLQGACSPLGLSFN